MSKKIQNLPIVTKIWVKNHKIFTYSRWYVKKRAKTLHININNKKENRFGKQNKQNNRHPKKRWWNKWCDALHRANILGVVS